MHVGLRSGLHGFVSVSRLVQRPSDRRVVRSAAHKHFLTSAVPLGGPLIDSEFRCRMPRWGWASCCRPSRSRRWENETRVTLVLD